MKTQTLLLCLMAVGALFCSGCGKDAPTQATDNGKTTPDTTTSNMQAGDTIYIQTGNTQITFGNNESLLEYCTEHGIVEMYETNRLLDSIYAKACELGIENSDIEKAEDVPQEMKTYWKHLFGTDFGTLPDQTNGSKLTWGTTLFDYENLAGNSKTCIGPTYWNLGAFNNKTTSLRVTSTGVGGIWFCHKKWYGKPRHGYFQFGVIAQLSWPYVGDANNNKYCSYCTTIH